MYSRLCPAGDLSCVATHSTGVRLVFAAAIILAAADGCRLNHTEQSNWTAREVTVLSVEKAILGSHLNGSQATLEAESGHKILLVGGVFEWASRKPSEAVCAVALPRIGVFWDHMGDLREGRLVAIGPGDGQDCALQLVDELLEASGQPLGLVLGCLENRFAFKGGRIFRYQLCSKPTRVRSTWEMRLLQNPSHLCAAFMVPEAIPKGLKLSFDGAVARVQNGGY